MTTTEQVAQNIGQALQNEEVAKLLAGVIINAGLANLFVPIVRTALSEPLGVHPEDIGPELVEEALQEGITAPYIAQKWVEDKVIKKTVELIGKYSDKYQWEDEGTIKTLALQILITGDEEVIIADSVREGLLKEKQQ